MHALDSLLDILPQVKHDIVGSSVNLLVQNTAAGLASKNKELYERASNLLDGYINNMGMMCSVTFTFTPSGI